MSPAGPVRRRERQEPSAGQRSRARIPHRKGYAAYVWVTTPAGKRTRKYVYGPDRETVPRKWIRLQQESQRRTVATCQPTLGDFLGY